MAANKKLSPAEITNLALAAAAKTNRSNREGIVKATFTNPRRCVGGQLDCVAVVIVGDQAFATHKFRPYRGDSSHNGLGEASVITDVTGLPLDESGFPIYKEIGDPSTREFKLVAIEFGTWSGTEFTAEA